MRRFIPIAALLLLAGCQQQAGEAKLVPPTQAQAEKIIASTEKSYGSGNAAEIMAHYADGAVMFDQGLLAPIRDEQREQRLALVHLQARGRQLCLTVQCAERLSASW